MIAHSALVVLCLLSTLHCYPSSLHYTGGGSYNLSMTQFPFLSNFSFHQPLAIYYHSLRNFLRRKQLISWLLNLLSFLHYKFVDKFHINLIHLDKTNFKDYSLHCWNCRMSTGMLKHILACHDLLKSKLNT